MMDQPPKLALLAGIPGTGMSLAREGAVNQKLESSSVSKGLSRSFIVGCPRSGTTIIQAYLARHSELFTLPETHYFEDLLGRFEQWMKGEVNHRVSTSQPFSLLSSRRHRLLTRRMADALGMPDFKLQRRLRRVDYIPEFARLLDREARRRSCSAWLEKTPDHLAYIEPISLHLPDARFIHVIRRGEDVIASAVDAEIRFFDRRVFRGGVAFWIERWKRALEAHLHYLGEPGHLVIAYEDFVEAPDQVGSLIMKFIGLQSPTDICPQPLSAVAHAAEEPWKDAAVGARVRAPVSKFEELFGPRLKAWIRENLPDYELLRARFREAQNINQAVASSSPGPAPAQAQLLPR